MTLSRTSLLAIVASCPLPFAVKTVRRHVCNGATLQQGPITLHRTTGACPNGTT